MKKVTFLISSLGGGGAEGVCINLANGLTRRGWQVTVVVLHLNNAVRREELDEAVKLVVLGRNHARSVAPALLGFLRRRRPERILVFNHQLAVLLVILRHLVPGDLRIIARNINTLSQKRAVEPSFWHRQVVQKLTRLFYGRVDRIVAQSEGMKSDLVASYGVSNEKVTTIHNPISAAFDGYSLQEPCERANYLLCVGRLEPQKAFHIAMGAFASLVGEYPDLRLKIVGRGSLEASLKRLSGELGVADKVDFEGYQEHITPYFLKAKLTLLTSLYEGFPNVLVESISLGTPIVAFDCKSGPSEIVVDGVNGFLVENTNTKDLIEKIKISISKQWDSQAIKNSSSKFERERIISHYEDVLS
ncbi:MAG: glycosyltransferase [Balneolaceae bacterium]|nr:glycosyltransferase [Balneolaceae bacterium]